MEYRPLGRSGLFVPRLVLGTLTFGRETDEPDAQRMLGRYLDAGGTMLDTADVYGASEEILGRLLAGRRDDVLLASKVGMPSGGAVDPNALGASRTHIRRRLERTLRRLGTDHLDLYQLHCWDPLTPLEETLSTLDALVQQGSIRYVGVSNFTGWQVAKALGVARLGGWTPLVSLSPQYSLAERGFERDLAGVCEDEGLGVLAYSPLGGGLLTGKYLDSSEPPAGSRGARRTASTASLARRLRDDRSRLLAGAVRDTAVGTGRTPAQVALSWVLGRPGVTGAVIGARTPAQLADNLSAAAGDLVDEHRARLDEVSSIEPGYPHDWLAHYGIRQGPRPDRDLLG